MIKRELAQLAVSGQHLHNLSSFSLSNLNRRTSAAGDFSKELYCTLIFFPTLKFPSAPLLVLPGIFSWEVSSLLFPFF